jgi:hypothetical protein
MKNRNSALSLEGFEVAYEALAVAIDIAGEKNETVFLAKLALTMAHEQGDIAVFQKAIAIALQDLE